MKTIIYTISCFLGLLLFADQASAQQISVFNNLPYNPAFFNPAATGAGDRENTKGAVGLLYRQQWMMLDSRYAPQTFSFNADVSGFIDKSGRIGLGLGLTRDKVHFTESLKANVNFAYYLLRTTSHDLSLGVVAGWTSFNLDFGDDVLINNPFDYELYSGQYKKGVFDGGPGLHYRFRVTSDQVLNLDVAMPQLFTSDLNYDEGLTYKIEPHLLAGVSYRFDVAGIGIQPHIFYRDLVGEYSIKKARIDADIRVHFLEDRFWVAAGKRFDASAVHFGFGINAIENLTIAGIYETHDVFGGTFEAGVSYVFGQSCMTSEMKSQWTKLQIRANDGLSYIKRLESGVIRNVDSATEALESARESVSEEKRKYFINEQAKKYLDAARSDLASLIATRKMLEDTKKEAGDFAGSGDEAQLRCSQGSLNALNKTITKASEISNAAEQSFTNIEKQVSDFEARHDLAPVDLKLLVQRNDVRGLQKYYQGKVDKMFVKPRQLKVALDSDPGNIFISYSFRLSEEKYDLNDKDLEPVKFLMSQIAGRLRELDENGIKARLINISAQLNDDKSSLVYSTDAEYNGMHGYTLDIKYNFSRMEGGRRVASAEKMNVTRGKGALNLGQLTALLMYGMEKSLYREGIKVPVDLEIITSVDQPFSQVYSIEIEVEK